MKRDLRVLAAAGSLVLAFSIGEAAFAQKQGGVLKIYFFDSPASMSIHEETTAAGQGPMMGVFNNLVLSGRTFRKAVCSRSFRTLPVTGHGTRTRPS